MFSFLDNQPNMCVLPQKNWNLCEKITVAIATKKIVDKSQNFDPTGTT